MTREEFAEQMQRIVAVYSDRAFPTERVQIVYAAVKNYPARTFQVAVDDIIGDCMQPPPLSKIREYLMAARKKTGDHADIWEPKREEIRKLERATNEQGWCHMCFNSGLFMAHRKDDPHQCLTVFLCTCKAGAIAAELPEHRGKTSEWTVLTAKDWRRDMEAEPPRRAPDKPQVRNAVASLFRAKDLNRAIGNGPAAKRERDLDRDFDPEL